MFARELFKDVGAACAIGILDLINKNKINRIVKSEFENLQNVYSMIATKVLENPQFKMDYKLKKDIKSIFQSKDFEIFKKYAKIFTFNLKKADPNQNSNHRSSKLPAIKQDNSRANMNKYFEKLASNEIQRLNTQPSNNPPHTTKIDTCKTEPSIIELHNLKHLVNNTTNNNNSNLTGISGIKEVVINDKDDVYDSVQT